MAGMARWFGRARKKNSMIEVLPNMPQGVTGIRVSGRLLGTDLREFKPAMEEMLSTAEIRIVEVIASDYEGFGPGGLVEDLKLGLGALVQRHSAFKRIAVVTDKAWVAHAMHALGWMVPGELALFGLDELDRAKEWAAG
jgi:SpoIIAA-like